MGMKPRANPIDKENPEEYLWPVEMVPSENGKHKTARILLDNIGMGAIEIAVHRRPDDSDITRMGVTKANWRRVGRGMTAMKPGAEKEVVLTVRYFDGS